jgi:hypothetical protein
VSRWISGKRLIYALALASMMIAPYIANIALAFIPVFNSIPGTTNAVVLTGTLTSDRYDLWQYSYKLYRFAGETPEQAVEEAKSMLFEPLGWHDLRLGMTEYGEFIVANSTLRAGLALGPDFSSTESLAGYPNLANVFSGWVLYLNYTRSGASGSIPATATREVLAWATSGNFLTPGGGRGVLGKWSHLLWSSPQVTTGALVPNGIKVLYESARLAIVRANISIYDNIDLNGDGRPDATDYVADVVFTVVFNKVSKYAIIYKDVVIKLDRQLVGTIYSFYCGNREKLDIAAAINRDYDSYVHYYHNFSETVYQYPIIDWNKTDILVAYNDGDPDNSGNVTDPQYVVFKFYWPNATEFSVYDPNEITPRPTGFSPTDPRDGLLTPGTMVPDIPTPPGEPGVPHVVVQWRFTRTACPPGDILCMRINALLDSLLDSTVQVPGTSEYVPVTRQLRFVEVLGMTTRSASTMQINPSPNDLPVNREDGARAFDETLRLYKGTWDAQDRTRYPSSIAGSGHGGYTGGGDNSPGLEVLYFWHQVFTPDDLNMVDQHTFKLLAVGFNAPPEDTAGSSALAGPHFFPISQPMPMLDKFVLVSRRSIPYILQSTITGDVSDTSPDGFYRVIGPLGFVFADRGQPYDDVINRPAEPIAGGFSAPFERDVNETHKWVCRYFYPSINQLYERVAICDLIGKVQGNLYEQKVFRYPMTNYTATGIISVAGPKANQVSRYFNDFSFAILREGPDPYALIRGVVTGTAPTSDPAMPSLDIFPVSTWNVSKDTGYRSAGNTGYFVVFVARDVNGTLGYVVWGWESRDSFWGSVWASYYLGHFGGWLPPGTVALVVQVTYTSDFKEAQSFTIVEALGTIMNFKLSYERAFGKFPGIPELPPSPPLVSLGTINEVNSRTYRWRSVGITSYIGSYVSDGSDEYTKTIIGWPWWGEYSV